MVSWLFPIISGHLQYLQVILMGGFHWRPSELSTFHSNRYKMLFPRLGRNNINNNRFGQKVQTVTVWWQQFLSQLCSYINIDTVFSYWKPVTRYDLRNTNVFLFSAGFKLILINNTISSIWKQNTTFWTRSAKTITR